MDSNSDSADIELNSVQQKISELITTTPVPGRHAARSAIRHIQRAWRLRDVDLEMAVFRAITGEEEAARAIFHSLQRRQYSGASRLNWRRHEHKAAVAPFFDIVVRFVNEIPHLQAHLKWNKEDPSAFLELGIRIAGFPPRQWMYPIPPLNFSLSANEQVHDFAPEIAAVASDANIESIQHLIERRANERNRLLYASDEGIPNVGGPLDGYLRSQRDTIFRMLGVYMLIDPFPDQQLLVQQALNAFLTIVPRLKASAPSR